MNVGSLFAEISDLTATYSYFHSGTNNSFLPTLTHEADDSNIYSLSNGNLFNNKPVAWKDSDVILDGIDIKISLSESIFAERLSFQFGKGTELPKGIINELCGSRPLKSVSI